MPNNNGTPRVCSALRDAGVADCTKAGTKDCLFSQFVDAATGETVPYSSTGRVEAPEGFLFRRNKSSSMGFEPFPGYSDPRPGYPERYCSMSRREELTELGASKSRVGEFVGRMSETTGLCADEELAYQDQAAQLAEERARAKTAADEQSARETAEKKLAAEEGRQQRQLAETTALANLATLFS